jgi:hypothetical protein
MGRRLQIALLLFTLAGSRLVGCGGTTVSDQEPLPDPFPCTDEGIREAIAEGGGPHVFDCAGPTRIETVDTIEIDHDVVLDGRGELIVDAQEQHVVFSILEGVSAELRGFTITRGVSGVFNRGSLKVANSTISGNVRSGGISNYGHDSRLVLEASTVSDNTGVEEGGGVKNLSGTTTVINSTVSGNRVVEGEQYYWPEDETVWVVGGTMTLLHSTVVGTIYGEGATVVMKGTVIQGGCTEVGFDVVDWVSGGYNLQAGSGSCNLFEETDELHVGVDELDLGDLQDNGGPTMTHALGDGSVAIDTIPSNECLDHEGGGLTSDQRGAARDSLCDAGAFERVR